MSYYMYMPDSILETISRAEQVRRGDRATLAAALDEYRPRLSRTIALRLDPRLAGRFSPDDVAQESFLNASQRCRHVEGNTEAELFVWLRMIVLQTIADIHRRHLVAQKRAAGREAPLRPKSSWSAAGGSLAARLLDSLTSPSEAVGRVETADRIHEALGRMSELDQEVLSLRHFEELSNQETAAILGIEEKAASIRYFRALRRLRGMLEEAGFDTRSVRV